MTHIGDSVEQLTRTHKKSLYTVDGYEIHDRPSLLEQLREAIFGGMEKTGGSGSKAKLPISESAVDLYELIDTQVTEAWAAFTGRVPTITRPETLLAEWAAGVQADTIVTVTRPEQHDRWDEAKNRNVPFVIRVRTEYTAADLAAQWVATIEDFLNPERTREIQGACIHCGASKVSRRKDGETVLAPALVFRRDRDTDRTLDARCLNCGTVWPPSQFEYLARAIGATTSEPSETITA